MPTSVPGSHIWHPTKRNAAHHACMTSTENPTTLTDAIKRIDELTEALETLRDTLTNIAAETQPAHIGMLSVRETAERLGVSRQTVYRMIDATDDNGEPVVPLSTFGSTYLIPGQWVEAVLRGEILVGTNARKKAA